MEHDLEKLWDTQCKKAGELLMRFNLDEDPSTGLLAVFDRELGEFTLDIVDDHFKAKKYKKYAQFVVDALNEKHERDNKQ